MIFIDCFGPKETRATVTRLIRVLTTGWTLEMNFFLDRNIMFQNQ